MGVTHVGALGIKDTDFIVMTGAGVPSGTTNAGKGSLYIDLTNANIYINSGTKAAPVWKLVTRAA